MSEKSSTSPARTEPETEQETKTGKVYKYGIVYLSYIPDGLTVKMLREIMSEFGEVGKIYLEPDENNETSKMKRYNEGWIEFKKKRVAKLVAKSLNGTPLEYGKKNSRLSGQIWSIRYMHRFKWANLTEQLELDKATRDQKRRFEMAHTKKQVDFYQRMTERSRIMKSKKTASDEGTNLNLKEQKRIDMLKTKQNKPTDEGKELTVSVDEDLLNCIFKKIS